jgi:glutamyl-tRNA reductase
MPILALGVSHRRAPVELLERLTFGRDDYPKAYGRARELPAVREAVVLSTCNRVEVFAAVPSYHAGFQDLKRFLSESRDVPFEDFAEPLTAHYESDAAEHLFRVAAGIDSAVLGEPQILSQVRAAFRTAQAEGAVGPLLSALFRGAIRAGRRARAETAIEASPSALIAAGVELAARAIGPLSGRPAAVVGAGAMAALAARHLRDLGLAPIRIVNRSPERARRLAVRAGAEALALQHLDRAVAEADLVVSSTAATGVVIGVETVRRALAARDGRPLFLLDLAVPRDVDPAVRTLDGAHMADIDDLGRAVEAERAEHEADGGDAGWAAEIAAVEAIVAQEVERFESWRRASRVAPLIQALLARADDVRAAELARQAPRLAGLTDREREAVEALAGGIVGKLLHEPIVRLRERPGPAGDALARALAELFGIGPFPPE